MKTKEVANQLVEYCRAGDFDSCYVELYDPTNVRSIESEGSPNPEVVGIEAIKQKGKNWQSRVQSVNSSKIGDPIISGNFFAVPWKMNITFNDNPRTPVQWEELALYEVNQNGKIVREQFFYAAPNRPQNGFEK